MSIVHYNCPLFLSFAQSVVKDTNMAFAIVLQLFYDFFSCRFFFNLLANEPKEEVSSCMVFIFFCDIDHFVDQFGNVAFVFVNMFE